MTEYNIPWDTNRDFSVNITDSSAKSVGMSPYYTLFIEVGVHFEELCLVLDEQEGVSTPPTEYYHITLKTVGQFDGEFQELVSIVEQALDGVEPFEVSFSGVDVFPNCVFIPVEDGNESLVELHSEIVSESSFDESGYEGESYAPHVTVGRFDDSELNGLFGELNEFRDTEWGNTEVESIHLVRNGTSSVDGFCTFESVKEFTLG
jgi:2'-5' RNA ligase